MMNNEYKNGRLCCPFAFFTAEKGEKELSAEKSLCAFLCALLSLRWESPLLNQALTVHPIAFRWQRMLLIFKASA
jgi:hypothetical protein